MARASTPVALVAVLLVLVATLVMPGPARAGGYNVYACNATIAGGANNSWGAVADNGMTAYADCPNPQAQGLVARNVYDNGQSSWLSGAYMIFDAPPGTVVDSISFEAGLRRHNCSWQVALVGSGFDLGGNTIWGLPANQDCNSWFVTPNENTYFNARFNFGVNAPRVRFESRCGAGSCPRNGVAAVHVRNVDVRVRDDTPPALSGGRGALWTSNGWLSGTQAIGFDASDGAGIREATISVDGTELRRRALGCDYTQRAPCGNGSLDATTPTAALGGDGDHTITLTAVDAGGNPASTSRVVHIDNTPPDAPQGLTLDGGDGWRSTNDFDLRWNVVAPKVGAHVAGAEWDLCTADGKTCKHGSQAGRDLAKLSDLKVPAPGEYTLKLWLRDEAGNQDARLSAPLVKLRYDDSSPTLAFEPLRTDDPTLLAVQTSDRGSGVGSGVIEIRRQGVEQWMALPTTLTAGRLTARLDDEHLPDGAYEVRARAADLAGNERSTDRRSDGSSAAITLPLRLRTRIDAGMVQRQGRRIRFAHTAFARYGQLVRVRGKLVSPEGNPLQGVEVQVFTAVRGAPGAERLIATVKTSRRGGFSFLVRRGPSRTIRIRYGGTAQIQGTTRTLTLNVRARTSMRPNRRHLVNGETVTFHGRVRTGDIPAQGKLVEMQVWLRGKWRTFATTRADRRGLWKYDYRFDGTRGLQTYRFRAKLPPEAGYPFAAGGSRAVRVHVKGL